MTTAVRGERRRRPELRRLVDEMLATLRATVAEEMAEDASRVDAERQLAGIMARVRAEALRALPARDD